MVDVNFVSSSTELDFSSSDEEDDALFQSMCVGVRDREELGKVG